MKIKSTSGSQNCFVKQHGMNSIFRKRLIDVSQNRNLYTFPIHISRMALQDYLL